MIGDDWPFKVLDTLLCAVTEVLIFCLLSGVIEASNDIETDAVGLKWTTLVAVLLDEVAFVSCDVVEDSSARDLVERWPGISAVKLKDDFLEVTVIDSTLVILEAVMRLSDVERLERSSA